MAHALNQFGQPVGPAVPNWSPPPKPSRQTLVGRYCRIEPLDAERHAGGLFAAYAEAPDDSLWTYLAYGPFSSPDEYAAWIRRTCAGDDPLFFAIIDTETERAVGVAGYLRIQSLAGSIEVGHIVYAPGLQRSLAGTEAMYLMIRHAMELGYRRCEWKCDALNARSRTAALRLGFTFEGIFRQAMVYKGRNRDTAWFAIVDQEWPVLRQAFETWLEPDNFDEAGLQKARLSDLTAAALGRID